MNRLELIEKMSKETIEKNNELTEKNVELANQNKELLDQISKFNNSIPDPLAVKPKGKPGRKVINK